MRSPKICKLAPKDGSQRRGHTCQSRPSDRCSPAQTRAQRVIRSLAEEGVPGPWVVEETRAAEADAVEAKKSQQSRAGRRRAGKQLRPGTRTGLRVPGVGRHCLQQEPASVPETCTRGHAQEVLLCGARPPPPSSAPQEGLVGGWGRPAARGRGRQQGAQKGQVGCRAWMAQRLQGRSADSRPGLTTQGIQRERGVRRDR